MGFSADTFELFTDKVAGLAHYVKIEKLKDYNAGTRLVLVREPENEHDKNAVRCEIHFAEKGYQKIGYVPRDRAMILASLMDNGYGTKMTSMITTITAKRGLVEFVVLMEKA